MGSVIGALIPFAVVIAVSPIPIIGAILMLFAPNAEKISIDFLIGWIAGILAATVALLLIASTTSLGSDSEPSTFASWVKLVLGLALFAIAVRQWRGRPAADAEPSMPAWMSAIDKVTAGKAMGLGFLLAAINPKNLAMSVAAGITIAAGDLSAGGNVVAVVVFTLIACCTIAVPVIGYAVAADRMRGPLDHLKSWLGANNATVLIVMMLVIGSVLFGKGLGGLL
jgi:threonine/homoserine/homoserine lactone efflux protein